MSAPRDSCTKYTQETPLGGRVVIVHCDTPKGTVWTIVGYQPSPLATGVDDWDVALTRVAVSALGLARA